MEKLVENKRLLSKEKIKVSFLNQYLTNNLYFAGLVIFCCIGFLAVYILDDFGDYIDILTSVIWMIFLLSLLLFSTKFIVKYMYLVFLVITNLVGVFIIENTDIYLYELRAQSEDYNSLWVLSWVHFIFIVCLYIFDNVFDNKFVNKMSKDKERWIYKGKDIGDIILIFVGLGFILISLILLVLVMKNGTAHQLKIDRFEYGDRFLHGFWGSLNNIISYIVPVIALLLIKKYKLISFVMIGLYFVYLFFIGVKFGTFLTSVCFLLPVFFIENKKVDIKKIVGIIVLLVVALLGVVFVFNRMVYDAEAGGNIAYLKDRGAQQGQLWWAVYGDYESQDYHVGEFVKDELGIIVNSQAKENYNHGIYKVMKITAPSNVVEAKIETGSTYAYSTQASLYYYFNYIGLFVFDVFGALLLSFFTNIYWGALSGNRLIESVIVLKFVYNSYWVIAQSDITSFFAIKKMFYLFVAVVWGWMIILRYRRFSFTPCLKTKRITSMIN